jgi:hypothetical protein
MYVSCQGCVAHSMDADGWVRTIVGWATACQFAEGEAV